MMHHSEMVHLNWLLPCHSVVYLFGRYSPNPNPTRTLTLTLTLTLTVLGGPEGGEYSSEGRNRCTEGGK